MLVIILSAALIVAATVAVSFASKNQVLVNDLGTVNSEIEALKESLEMANSGRQLLRNEITVLKSQIRVMESKSMHGIVDTPKTAEEVVKKKKKYFKKKSAPKMSSEQK
jgi:septal ring factor EnvC (AmiA/AmiB activator)